jgi:hypothetical protein
MSSQSLNTTPNDKGRTQKGRRGKLERKKYKGQSSMPIFLFFSLPLLLLSLLYLFLLLLCALRNIARGYALV